MKGVTLVIVAGFVWGGCGGRALVLGGRADAADAAPEASSRRDRAFDVTATLTVTPPADQGGAWAGVPSVQKLTLVWQEEGQGARVVVGAHGTVVSSALSQLSNGAVRASSPLTLPLPYDDSCTRTVTVAYEELSFTEVGGVLSGTARATLTFQLGADVLTAPATATLVGTPDQTPPELSLPTMPIDPLAPFVLPLSEPLPAGTSVKLIGKEHGNLVVLTPVGLDAAAGAIAGFAKPDVMLRFGETYNLLMEGRVDFAGNGANVLLVPITTRAAPPLAPPDGFESVTGSTFGGAGVLDDGPLTALAGTKSLLLNTGFGGGFGFLPYSLGPSLTVRLAVPAGATVVRFERQLVAPDPTDAAMFVGAVRVASVGHPVESTMNLAATDFTRRTLAGAGDVYVTATKTIELPLPPEATDEITFEIAGVTFQCGLPPSPTLLVVDDLRVE